MAVSSGHFWRVAGQHCPLEQLGPLALSVLTAEAWTSGGDRGPHTQRRAKQAAHLAVGVEEGTDGAVGLVEGSCRIELSLSLEAGCLVLPLQRK